MRKQHKIRPLLLLLITAAPLLFTIGWQLQQQLIRHRMQETMEHNMLQTLVLEPQQIHWKEEGKELLINGELFDVKEMQTASDGRIMITGLSDKEETRLLEFVREKMPEQDSQKRIAKLFQIQLTLPDPVYHPGTDNIRPDIITYPHYSQDLFQTYLSILAPPPKQVA